MANLVINFSDEDFFEEAVSTSSRIRLTVESSKVLVTRICRVAFLLMQPLRMASPCPTSAGRDSPVNAEVSR